MIAFRIQTACLGAALLALMSTPSPLVGQTCPVLDFETLPPSQAMNDLTVISDQYRAEHGVTFEIAGGGAPVVSRVGGLQTAMQGPVRDLQGACGVHTTRSDMPADPGLTGCHFLSDNLSTEEEPLDIIMRFDAPVNGTFGELYDIDNTERWLIHAQRADGTTIQSVTLEPTATPEDNGARQIYQFFDLGELIHSVRYEFTGAGEEVGFAIDNVGTGCDSCELEEDMIFCEPFEHATMSDFSDAATGN